MRILVTGGAGFIGSHLIRRLLDDKHEVVCVDNLVTGKLSNLPLNNRNLEVVTGNICHAENLPIVGPFEQIYHLASIASPKQYLRMPLSTLTAGSEGTYNALDIARSQRASFLLASSSEVYGEPLEHPQKETHWGNVNPIGPRSCYDEGKRFGEALTMAFHGKGLNTHIARIFNTYGPKMQPLDGRAVPNFINQALSNEPLTIYGDGLQTRSLCHVDDTVEGLMRLMSSDYHLPVNIGNPDECIINELAEQIITLCNSQSVCLYKDKMIDDPSRRCPDISLAKKVLGWNPRVKRQQGLVETIQYFKQLGD